MERSSLNILEALQSKNYDYRNIYNLLEIYNIGSVPHPELENIVTRFTDPKIIIAIGLITSCFIIQYESKTKVDVIEISLDVKYYKCSSGQLRNKILDVVKLKDFIPDPLVKKIVLINSFSKIVSGEIFYEVSKNKYTDNGDVIYNFLDFDKKKFINGWQVVDGFLKEIRNEQCLD